MAYHQRNTSIDRAPTDLDGNRSNTARKIGQSLDSRLVLGDKGLGTPSVPKNYWDNSEKLNKLVQKHLGEFREKFDERKIEGMDKIAMADLFIFLQECFYSDDMLVFEKESDDRDFFQSIGSYKRLLKIAEDYFIKQRNKSLKEINIKEAELTFDECFEILDHWFQTDANVIMVTETEKEKLGDNKQQDVKGILQDTIDKYQQLINASKSEVEKQVLQGTIETLQKKIDDLENEDGHSPDREARKERMLKALKKKEEKRMKALREIFDFYSKQLLNGVRARTFEKLERQTKTINMGKLTVILSNYQMKIDQLKLKEAFNKIATTSEELTFEQFYLLLQKIAKDIEFIEKKVVKPNPEIMKEYTPVSYKQIPSLKGLSKNELRKGETTKYSTRNANMRIEEMCEHMGLYDGSYKTNFQGLYLAFNSEPFTSPIAEKPKTNRSIDQSIAGEISKRNELRKEARDGKLVEKYILQNFKEPPQKPISKTDWALKNADSYASIQANKVKVTLFDKKMTFKDIESSEYEVIKKMGIERKFSPNDLIEENDEEDNLYLAEYNLSVEREKRKQKKEENKKSKQPSSLNSNGPQSYSQMYSSKSSRYIGTPMVDEIHYGRKYQTPRAENLGQVDLNSKAIYQSIRQPHSSQAQLQKIHPLSPQEHSMRSINQALAQRGVGTQSKKYSDYVLDRAQQIQLESQRKEARMLSNAMNMQNSKIEQGLRVARRYQ